MKPDTDAAARAGPTAPREREPILDVLRGFAILGILLINVQFMSGPEWMAPVAEPAAASGVEAAARFLIGWLAAGKFLSSLAVLFGVGAALVAARYGAARFARPLLARRYRWLIVFGIAHMLLVYPGDILFVYGVTGILLLAFVGLTPRTMLAWAAALIALYGLGVAWLTLAPAALPAAAVDAAGAFPAAEHQQALEAFTAGSYWDMVAEFRWQAFVLQSGQLTALPWILALFLVGFAAARSGVLDDFAASRALLRRCAIVGVGIGLPANVAVGLAGPFGAFAQAADPAAPGAALVTILGQVVGVPLLAVGYLCALALLCLQYGAFRPLAAVGRMALSAYLVQNALGLALIRSTGVYGELSTGASLLFVAAIWAVLLVAAPLWLKRFQFGPFEWLWRSLTYRRLQPMRVEAPRAAR